VKANGTSPHAAIQVNPASVSFGSAPVGKKVSQTVSVANTGSMSVNINQANVSDSQFSVSGLVMPLSLPVGQSSNFQVSFVPNSSGIVTGTLTVTTDAGVASAQVALSGNATPAAQQVSLNPASLNLGTITVGSTGRGTATVSNVGGSNLMVSLVSISGGPFGVTGITTPSTIAPGASVTLNVTYSPTIAGNNSGAITITSNDPQTPTSTISLAGTATVAAVAPTITTAPANQTVTAGQTASFTVVAGGTAPLNYQWQKNGANIIGATSASYTTATTTMADSGSTFLAVVTNTAGTVTSAAATLTVSAAAVVPTITTPPANQTVAAGQTASFAVVAGGTAPLSYQWQKNGANIAGATAASYTTAATTTADSGSTFQVVVTNTAGTVTSAAATLTVTAAPVPAIQVSSTSINFGNVVAGSTLSQALIIKNIGTATLNVSQITESGASFSISGFTLPLNLNAGQQTTITAAFLPTLVGAASGSISIVSNAPASPTSVSLSGTGIAATLTLNVSPASLSFGNVTTGTSSATQSVTITNTGNSNVTISQISTGGAGYSVTGGSTPVTLTPTQSLVPTVQFGPAVAGSVNGSISIVSNANGSPASVTLSGTGVAPVQHSASLAWNASSSTVSGYNVYRSTVSGSAYTKINSSVVSGLSYTDSTVQSSTTYFYVTTSVDSSGIESSYSNEVQAVIP
jgi:hypothetical protein